MFYHMGKTTVGHGPLTLQEHPPHRATRRPMPELSDLVRNLDKHVVRFYAWADAYPPAERSGAWECAYHVPRRH